MLLITLADVFIIQIQIRLFCDGHAGMSQELAQCVDVHPIHQTSLGEVVSQTVGTVFFIQTNSVDVPLEVGFKVVTPLVALAEVAQPKHS